MLPEREGGFILIGAIWLLVLAGSIAALLILRGVDSSRDAAAEASLLRSELATQGAIELVVADALFNGPRSRWWSLPARGQVVISDVPLSVEVTSEATRFDINSVDLTALDDHLRGKGVRSSVRGVLLTAVASKRSADGRYRSLDEVSSLFSRVENGDEALNLCLLQDLTLYSGYTVPTTDVGQTFIADTPVRVVAISPGTQGRMAIIRAGVTGRPFHTMEWRSAQAC